MITKTLFVKGWKCLKRLFLDVRQPELAEPLSEDAKAVIAEGVEVGKLAYWYFDDVVDVTKKFDGTERPDIVSMDRLTQEEIMKGTPVIAEATFIVDDMTCSVDFLRKHGAGVDIIEVKSGAKLKPHYLADVAYQRYVLEEAGVKVMNVYIMHPNRDYVRGKDLDVKAYFTMEDVTKDSEAEYRKVPAMVDAVRKVLAAAAEPGIDLNVNCRRDSETCPFWKYCTQALVSPNVFDLRLMQMKTKLSLYAAGKIGYADLESEDRIAYGKTPSAGFQRRQIDTALYHPEDTYVDQAAIRAFLRQLKGPLYFLDFETMNPAIPPYENSRPYDQIPFQYSLHIVRYEGAPLEHREFLAESGPDPRPEVARRLCEDIPMDVVVIAYDAKFERSRLTELADLFSEYRNHLLNIRDNVIDLEDPFKDCSYYRLGQGGSTSIKRVLPSIFPGDPDLDYKALEGVHNGAEARIIFPRIQYMKPEEARKTREDLLKYCCLDTLAMVRIWEELVRVAA